MYLLLAKRLEAHNFCWKIGVSSPWMMSGSIMIAISFSRESLQSRLRFSRVFTHQPWSDLQVRLRLLFHVFTYILFVATSYLDFLK